MTPLTYRARALGPLRAVDWAIPSGVSVVVGPNRVGKSTLLRLPELIKIAIDDGLNEAVKVVFEGVSYLRNFSLPASAPISIGFGGTDVEWTTELIIHGGEIAAFPSESLNHAGKKAVAPVATAISVRSYRTYHYEINHLLRFGSQHSSGQTLLTTGENVFPLLRNWRDRPELEERYEFVLATMREIFPHLGRVGFEQAGQTVTMTVSDRRWPDGKHIPIARESTGFITALLHLCAIASADRGGLVTLDEIETSLHPRAIRVLIEAMRHRAASHDLRVVLATQSETVLDQFRDDPSRVFVLEPKQERSPQALTELFSPEYLSQFSLGDLFAHLEFGADDPNDP
ncbi:MAG: AAA family ATPase [Enhygromyxa sp.]